MNLVTSSRWRTVWATSAILLGQSLSAQSYEEQGLFPTSMEEILGPSTSSASQPSGSSNQDPSYFLPETTAAQQSAPQTVVPTQRPRSQPLNQQGIPTQVLLPAPQPVAEAIQSPSTPTIVFGDTQIGFEEETENTEPSFDPGQLLADKQYADLEPWVLENQDVGMAGALGWSYFKEENYPKAIEWFEQSLRWDENFNEAAYGLALSLYHEGYLQQAEAVARWKLNAYPGMQDILGDIYMTRAIASFKAERYPEALEDLKRIAQNRPLTRGELLIEAWCYYHMGNLEKSASLFLDLYRQERDKVAAVGLYASLSRDGNWDRIQSIANEYGGPLADIYALYTSERYYDRRLYLQANQLAPRGEEQSMPLTQNVNAPKVNLSVDFVHRDGDSGLSELKAAYGPRVSGTLFSDGINRFDVSVGLVNLDAGQLPDYAAIGVYPNTTNPGYVITPTTSYNGMIEPTLGFYHEDWISPYIELGMTPLGGAADADFVGRVGIQSLYDSGSWDLEIYRRSVTESLLSYTGMKDPYSSLVWGRVLETGLHVSVYHSISEQLNVFGSMEVAKLTGQNVADNEKFRIDLGLSRTFKPDDFHYINFGPILTFYSYNKNLSFFTYGQGGYFSPEYLIQGLLSIQFMTEEGLDYLFKGELAGGGQSNNQASSPYFPLDPDSRTYDGTNESSGILISNLKGLMYLTDQWAFGAEIGYNKTPSYEELRGGIYTTIFFEPRKGLLETDFPNYQY
ncbi:MAG: cellulose synthase subunit BcsC-related outer membrane protein [Puniceicoccales bacterium]